MSDPDPTPRPFALGWRVLHWVIIANFVIGAAYAGWIVMVVLRPEGIEGPLFAAAKDVPMELLTRRRLYAIETWVILSGLAIYLAVTELLPRRLGRR